MLEGRKLSLEMQRESNSRVWTSLSILITGTCILLLASLWIGLSIAPPAPDRSQENLAQAHAKVLASIERIKEGLAAEQALNPALFEEMAEWVVVLDDFAKTSAKATQVAADSRDDQIWTGRTNLMVDDLQALMSAKEPILNLPRIRTSLSALYKPKGAISSQASAPLTAVREFSTAVADWVKLGPSATENGKSSEGTGLTWRLILNAKAPWRQISSQMDALESEAKPTDNANDKAASTAQAKAAQTLWVALNAHNLMQDMRTTDEQLNKVWLAYDRLWASLEKLPPAPTAILAPAPFSWSQFAFPGNITEGLMGAMALLVVGLSVLIANHIARHRHLKHLSYKWLSLTHQLENTVRNVSQPLNTSINQQEELIAEFNRLLEQSKLVQRTLNTPAETLQKSLEDQAWRAAARMQADLESELTLLREKLLNIHLQFCSGATHENLVYDLAFTAEGIQTVLITASDLGRSFALLKEHLHQNDTTGNDQEVVAMMAQISNLKVSVKRMTQQLRDLSNKLQMAVEDVPDGQRFEGVVSSYAIGRPYGNPSI